MENPLISSQKSSDSGLQAVLHPLVLLTISDYITRHTLRDQQGPIVGALLGQQNGREITIEHAFECATIAQNREVIMDPIWFGQRLDQMKTIHKSPQLDLVGWYTVLPKSGPTPAILPIHHWILSEHNESSMLLAVHPEEAVDPSVGSKLPLTIYETNYEADEPKVDQGEDKEMRDAEPPLKLKFRELSYSVETGEAEMISMDFVARGAGNATAVESRGQKKTAAKSKAADAKSKGKQRLGSPGNKEAATATEADELMLSREDEELIAALTAKANSVKMLQSRIKLLITYLQRLPPSGLSGVDPSSVADQAADPHTIPSHTILRSIQALVNRLALLVPSATADFEQEMLSEANDVHLMSLLNQVMQSVTEVRDIGKKHVVVEAARSQNKKNILPDIVGGSGSFNLPGAGDLSI
ncbi:COP9 signalosome-like protein subunit 6 [Pseudomassariella vexata]|uniref:COP9 signalosome complex subunit 6 n=1 Tax=Pseudomassariella vexata TaxID=1141098 RepID=A0A1Y2E1I9_9PEZI|nr:COP9 signalosome-like protein subunit 6 [Pseudomassariella vexata]ORY65214.1 COP9 signalosome-like protein subunit 6 [Pseudomassariella vexata]